MQNLYNEKRDALQSSINACTDVKEAADCIGRVLEQLRPDVKAGYDTPAMRREADRLIDAAKQSAMLLISATEADITPKPLPKSKKQVAKRIPSFAALIASAVLAFLLILEDMNNPALLALACTVGSALQLCIRDEKPLPQVEVRTRVNTDELMHITDRLISAIDSSLTAAEEEQHEIRAAIRPEITGDLLSPMQMLMEAVYTEDGSYALKAAPQLIDALGSEGITVVEYSEENRDLFDMFPGTEAGLTIRPAMVKDGKVLARGQATEGIN